MSNRDDEKKKLIEEILQKKKDRKEEEVKLVLEPETEEKETSTLTQNVLRAADTALKSLSEVLKKQKEDLLSMQKENTSRDYASMNADLEDLNTSLSRDFPEETDSRDAVPQNLESRFEEAERDLDTSFQYEERKALLHAFKRPFVMGQEQGKPGNVLLMMGPKGCGKQEVLEKTVSLLKEKGILKSEQVYTLDLSRYSSGMQEQVFLQDLYQALLGEGQVVCVRNFSQCFPSFLNMLSSLVTEGTLLLNKRYVLNQGILVENQNGLVKETVGSLSACGKYFVFMTEGKESQVQDAFGSAFLQAVLDKISFNALDEREIDTVIQSKIEDLEKQCRENVQVSLQISGDLYSWVKAHYDKTEGIDGISSLFKDFYICLSQMKLENSALKEIAITVENDLPYGTEGDRKVLLTRSRSSKEELESVQKELDEIIGLQEVKEYITSLQAHMALNARRKEQGLKVAEVSKHMIFTGNPGTGKTTIARLLSRYMKAIGALSKGQLVEVSRGDLVAQYVGQTAPLTMSVIKSALGGVLFIDEAYSLYRGKDDSFGLEAIDTLVKAMEDNRDNLIVILAGYKREMADFLEANSGLKSRFPNVIFFPDYTGEELLEIARLQAESKGYTIEKKAEAPLLAYFTEVQATRAQSAGNGRFARNTIEEAILKQAQRLLKEPESSLTELKLEDFEMKNTVQEI